MQNLEIVYSGPNRLELKQTLASRRFTGILGMIAGIVMLYLAVTRSDTMSSLIEISLWLMGALMLITATSALAFAGFVRFDHRKEKLFVLIGPRKLLHWPKTADYADIESIVLSEVRTRGGRDTSAYHTSYILAAKVRGRKLDIVIDHCNDRAFLERIGEMAAEHIGCEFNR